MPSYRVQPDISVLRDYLEVPGLGFLPVNAFVIPPRSPLSSTLGWGCPTGTSSATWPR